MSRHVTSHNPSLLRRSGCYIIVITYIVQEGIGIGVGGNEDKNKLN